MPNTTFYLRWYKVGIFLIIIMVGIGGVTRLTNSGLSMVDWEPLFGIIPPLSGEDWIAEFSNYKSYPEYKKINSDIDISHFKKIYFWEYLHRIFGRVIGLYFLFPFLYLIIKKQITREQFWKNGILILLVAFQGVLGWYMVKSGLVNFPHVSHFRLMLHFLTAMGLIVYCYYLYLELRKNNSYNVDLTKNHLKIFTLLLFFQIIYGTFVAGLNAGYSYNTFPLMNGKIIPYELFYNNTVFQNLFTSPFSIQYIHRGLGIILFLYTFYMIFIAIKHHRRNFFSSLELQLGSLIFIQFILGVSTLLFAVPLILALLHQLNTCLIILKCVELHYYS